MSEIEGSTDLSILFIEDCEPDARLIARELRRSGFMPHWERVETVEDLLDALTRRTFQLVISDSSVPRLGCLDALKPIRARHPLVPFIVVSGSIRTEAAVEAVRAGAADWISKDDLERLGPAVRRELARPLPAVHAGAEQQIHAAQEEERRRIARALHDGVGQSLTVLRHLLQVARAEAGEARGGRLDEALTIVDDISAQIRSVSSGLWPAILDDLGLSAALRWLVGRMSPTARPLIVPRIDEVGRLRAEVELACFRLAQEAITNAIRHAGAAAIHVLLRLEADEIVIEVRDDGGGFDPNAALRDAAARERMGLLGMRERVIGAGGRLQIDAGAGRGTCIRARFGAAVLSE